MDHTIVVRFPEKQSKELQERAGKMNVSVSSLVRLGMNEFLSKIKEK